MKTFCALALIPWLLISCASDSGKKKSTASTEPVRQSMTQRFGGGGTDPNSFKRDSEGKLSLKNAKRSPYEDVGQDPNFAGKGFKKKEYKAGDYARKSFWGDKQYDRQAYAGKTDGSRFQKTSDLQQKGAREATTRAKIKGDYQTGDYSTASAREANGKVIAKPSNDGIENRRDSYLQPEIIDYREQRQLTLKQANSLLGR